MHKYSNLGKAGDVTGTFWSEGRDLTNCANYARPNDPKANNNFIKTKSLVVRVQEGKVQLGINFLHGSNLNFKDGFLSIFDLAKNWRANLAVVASASTHDHRQSCSEFHSLVWTQFLTHNPNVSDNYV